MRVPSNPGLWAWEGSMPVGSLYTAGLAGRRFLEALEDSGELLGTPCNDCGRVYVPAALFCESCFQELNDYVPVGPEGEVVTFTTCSYDLDGNELDPPAVAVAVRLEGATSVLVHRGLGDPAEWTIGGRARVKLAAERVGSILDIEGFELA